MMDDTFADESGIPVLANLDDIPVHSTPIKGTKVPLPSTGPIMKIMHDKGKHATLAEQEISELPNIPEERSTSNRLHPGQGHKLAHVPSKDDRKKAAEFHITQRQNNYSELSKDKHKPLDNDCTLRNTNTVNDGEKLYKADSHFARRSALDSDSRFQSSEGLYLRYNHEDNLRSHGHSKQSRSHVPYHDSSKNNTSGQEKKESQGANTDKSVTKTESGQSTDNVKGNEGSRTLSKYTPDTNSNAFSSYAFSEKEMARRSLRQTRRQLEMTPENNATDFESVDGKRSPRFKVSSSGRYNDRTADVSPLARRARTVQDAKGFESSTGAARSLSTSVKQASYSEVEVSTIQKQRQEIQLLVTELKDRDRELGDMMKSHEQQLMAWEQDRHRVISLDQKCSQYEGDIQSKTAQLRSALMAVKDYKSKYASQSEEMEVSKSTAERLIQENQNFKQQLTECEDKCGMLQKSVQDLSNTVGRLQAREEELNTSLKLKEKDMISATSQMKELSDRLRQLDVRCKECQDREKQAVKERNDWQQKYEDRLTELQSLTNAVDGKSKEVSQLEEEICSLRHHLSVLQKDATMREKCQDEVIESMREKQERTDTQLKSFRELYERQLRELSKLQLQVDTSKDFINKQCSLEEQHLKGSLSTRGNSRLSDKSLDKPRNTLTQTSRYRDGDIHIHIDRDIPSLQQNTQSSGYQTQVSGNSRLSERSPDRQRNTLVQTNRNRDSDIDMHSLQQHTQSSGYQTQVSGNSRLSERSPDRQRNTLAQTNRHRDSDIDMHSLQQQTQSSGYQTQVSGNSRLSERSPDRQRNTQAQTNRHRDSDIDMHSLQQHTQRSGYQTQVSVNSRLSERSPDRQRNTLAQTNRHRDSDIDMHSLQHHTQSSGYQTQVSGNSRLSERSPDRQRNTLAQMSRNRDSDIDMHSLQQHTQSSGYQTQVSGNQSELLEPQSATGTHLQFVAGRTFQNQEQVQMGYLTNDDYAKFSKIMMQSSINSDALQKKEGTSLEEHAFVKPEILPKNVRYKDDGYSIGATKQFPFSEGAQTNPGINRSSDSERRDINQYSSGFAQSELPSAQSELPGVHPTQTQTLTYSTCDSPPREGGYVIEQPRADNLQNMTPDCDKHKEKHETNNVAAGRQASIQEGASIPPPYSETNNVAAGRQASIQEGVSIPPPYSDAYMFENRLCSFLEDVDDIDDNIWDDKGNVSRVIPEVEASPTHKLQKLLLESKMMINELVKTTESPVSKQVQPPEIEENKKK